MVRVARNFTAYLLILKMLLYIIKIFVFLSWQKCTMITKMSLSSAIPAFGTSACSCFIVYFTLHLSVVDAATPVLDYFVLNASYMIFQFCLHISARGVIEQTFTSLLRITFLNLTSLMQYFCNLINFTTDDSNFPRSFFHGPTFQATQKCGNCHNLIKFWLRFF